jgi:transcriptional regulator with XRE-family HTH domain
MSNIAANIKLYRTKMGLKQSELADMLGKSHNAISNWETGANSPDVDSIETMLGIFGIDANVLFGKENDPPSILAPATNGASVETLQGEDLADAIAMFAKLPQEALGDLKIVVEFLHYKYGKNKDA